MKKQQIDINSIEILEADELTPRQIVKELDKYIIGQEKAKKAVAIALRNRTRRKKLPEELRNEVAPKNIIMMGPTGVGKTEIARRLSKLCKAPFVKVEATKYTEVGYVGRDVESMVRDLINVAVNMVKKELRQSVTEKAERRAEEALLDILLPSQKQNINKTDKPVSANADENPVIKPPYEVKAEETAGVSADTREKMRKLLQNGALDKKEIEIVTTSRGGFPTIEIFAGTMLEEMDINFGNIGGMLGQSRKKRRKVTVEQAKKILLDEEIDKLIDMDKVSEIAIKRVEDMGIIFLDEIDKIAARESGKGPDVSREGVQRDILPIVEGCQVNTKFGPVRTDHILFIAAGAFHMSKPSDLIPELQGRFPIRVELNSLTKDDFIKILVEPKNALITQYKALLKTEGVTLNFSDDAIIEISDIAGYVNSQTENIGARRLHTILELLLEDISFFAPEKKNETIEINAKSVREKLSDIIEDRDLSRYIL